MQREYFYSCAKDLEPYLERELLDFFGSDVRMFASSGGFTIKTTFDKAVHFSIMTKVASRFFIKLGVIGYRQEKEIYKEAQKEIQRNNWKHYFLENDRIKINTIFDPVVKTKIKSPLFCSQILKDALVDNIQGIKGDPKNSNFDLLQRIEWHRKKECFFSIIYIDFYRRSLGNRGYKNEISHIAPLKESLAASILMSTKWDQEKYLYDPMCGSGTFLIEALLQKYNIAGQIFHMCECKKKERPFFPIRRLRQFTEKPETIQETLKFELDKYEHMKQHSEECLILGTDIFMDNIKELKLLLKKLGLNKLIYVDQKDFFETSPYNESGTIVFNPPYGERLNRIDNLQDFYHDIGEHLKNSFKDHHAYILMGDNEIRKSISLQTSSRTAFLNGKIECRLIGYKLF